MWDAEERPPARKTPVPHLILSPSSLSPLLGHFYSEHIKSRNQPNFMKTNAGSDFYPEHLDTLRISNSPANLDLSQKSGAPALPNPPQKSGISTPPSLPATPPANFSISNRQWLAQLENAATRTKQSSGELSNRHIWGPISPGCRVESMAHP